MTNSTSITVHYKEPDSLQVDWLYEDGRAGGLVFIRIAGCCSIIATKYCTSELYQTLANFMLREGLCQ